MPPLKKYRHPISLLIASLIAITTILFTLLVTLHYFDWNRAKPWLNARTSEALERPFTINGELKLVWKKHASGSSNPNVSWHNMIPWPHFLAQNVHLGNPTNMKASSNDMAHIKQVSFVLNPLALLQKEIAISSVHFDELNINLLRNLDGSNNWTFKTDQTSSSWGVKLQEIMFTKGRIHLVDEIKQADVVAEIDTIDTNNRTNVYEIAWHMQGKFNGEALNGNGKIGAVLSLQRQTQPYPIMAQLRVGQTEIAVEGTLTKPSNLAALDMRLKVSGVSMGKLYALGGLYLPETPPFSTEGHLIGSLSPNGDRWVYEEFSGKVGASDISGKLDYQSASKQQTRPQLSGTVLSHTLHFSDLAPLIGADSNASKTKRGAALIQPSNKILPIESFKTDRWNTLNADIAFKADNIIRDRALPINKLSTNLRLKDGILSLSPLNFDVAGGNLSSNIMLDGSGKTGKNTIKATLNVSARHLKLKQLLPSLPTTQASIGEINGDISLSATGHSIASLLGTSNGEMKTLINQGSVSKLLLEEMGLNIGSIILTRLAGDKQIRINCMATNFAVENGLMQARNFIVDTDDAIIYVNGNINLAQEQLNLTINPNSKGLRILSLRAPLYVKGSFKQPQINIDRGVLALKSGSAIALAALTPAAALLPLVNTGQEKSGECSKLLAVARTKPVAPPPSKIYRKK